MNTKPIIMSSGGGVQSNAVGVLVSQGKLPTPERWVIVNTGRESSAVWEYQEKYMRPLLASVGLEIEIAPHSLATVDLYSSKGELLIPAWTKDGQLSTFCSNEWKKRVVHRYLRSPERGYGPKNPVIQWIGFSRDEISRCKPSGVDWIENKWPLIMDYGLTLRRSDCVRIVEEAGLPTPPRSACYICPYRTRKEWKHQRDTQPEDHQKAIMYDRQVREKDSQGGVYLFSGRVPLEEADLDVEERPSLFQEMACTSGAGCWT